MGILMGLSSWSKIPKENMATSGDLQAEERNPGLSLLPAL